MIRFSLENSVSATAALVIPFFESENIAKQIPDIAGIDSSSLLSILETKDFEGKLHQTTWVYTGEIEVPRVLFLGLGKKESCGVRHWKQAVGVAVVAAQLKKITEISLVLPQEFTKKFGISEFAHMSVVSSEIANYAFDIHKEKSAQTLPLKKCVYIAELSPAEKKLFQEGIKTGLVIAESINMTRGLGNTPASQMTPAFLAESAKKLQKKNPKIKVKILSRPEIEKLKMGCFFGVASGSAQEPKFIIAEYFQGKKNEAPTVLVGKGITFDTGGLSLKPWDSMIDMKFDMLGGATALGILDAAANLNLKKNIVVLIPTCENMPSGTAYRPDDILVAMDGTSVLVENTDAEGRLILADALCYAARYNPKEVIDFATLTGACLVAIGNERSGLFSQDEKLVEGLNASSQKVGEQLWRLPLGEEFTEAIKCEVADIKNIGGVGGHPRFGGASVAAAFLEHFAKFPWAHIDLSCSHYGGKGKAWIRNGANGFGIETVVEYLK